MVGATFVTNYRRVTKRLDWKNELEQKYSLLWCFDGTLKKLLIVKNLVLFLQHTLKRLNRLCKIGNIWIKMVFIKIVKTALKRKCDWDIIGVTWSRSSGLSFRLCVIDQLWWWRHLLWLFFIHCWFEILNICALFDPHRGAHVIIVINSITRSCIQSALVDTWTKDDRIQESWSHIIIF